MSQVNKALVRRLVDDVWNKGHAEAADAIVDPNVIIHDAPAGVASGIEGLKQLLAIFRRAFPDLNITIDDEIVEGDKVVTPMTIRGTHKGELMGIAPTGKEVRVNGIYIYRIAGGKIAERWGIFDRLGMMQQLGVLPSK